MPRKRKTKRRSLPLSTPLENPRQVWLSVSSDVIDIFSDRSAVRMYGHPRQAWNRSAAANRMIKRYAEIMTAHRVALTPEEYEILVAVIKPGAIMAGASLDEGDVKALAYVAKSKSILEKLNRMTRVQMLSVIDYLEIRMVEKSVEYEKKRVQQERRIEDERYRKAVKKKLLHLTSKGARKGRSDKWTLDQLSALGDTEE